MRASVYTSDAAALMLQLDARSVYLFVVEGARGTGGCPIVQLQPTMEKHVAAQRELLAYMKRSIALFEADLERQHGAERFTQQPSFLAALELAERLPPSEQLELIRRIPL